MHARSLHGHHRAERSVDEAGQRIVAHRHDAGAGLQLEDLRRGQAVLAELVGDLALEHGARPGQGLEAAGVVELGEAVGGGQQHRRGGRAVRADAAGVDLRDRL